MTPMPPNQTDEQITALADAMVMVLNDLSEGNGVCDLVKAHARIAVEPFLLDDYGELPCIDWAANVVMDHNRPSARSTTNT